jgi:hypothetical protein
MVMRWDGRSVSAIDKRGALLVADGRWQHDLASNRFHKREPDAIGVIDSTG